MRVVIDIDVGLDSVLGWKDQTARIHCLHQEDHTENERSPEVHGRL